MDIKALQRKARKARDEIAREKEKLLQTAWSQQQAQAKDLVHQRIREAQDKVESVAEAAAERGCFDSIVLWLPFQACDLRHVLQEELHQSRSRHPDPYPHLRSLGPPSFQELEAWLKRDLQVQQCQGVCPLDWLIELHHWTEKWAASNWLKRLSLRRPALPEALENFWKLCETHRLKPAFETFRQFEESGVALRLSWHP